MLQPESSVDERTEATLTSDALDSAMKSFRRYASSHGGEWVVSPDLYESVSRDVKRRLFGDASLDDVKPLTCDDCPLAERDDEDPVMWCGLKVLSAPHTEDEPNDGGYYVPLPQGLVIGSGFQCRRAERHASDLRLLARRILKTLECAREEDDDAAAH